jgi:Helix-turn-helix domain
MKAEPFVKVPSILLERGKHLSDGAKLMWVILKSYQNGKTGRIFPSYSKLQEKSGKRRGSIADALLELEAFGWLRKKKQFSKVTNYELFIPPDISPTKEGQKYWRARRREIKTARREWRNKNTGAYLDLDEEGNWVRAK